VLAKTEYGNFIYITSYGKLLRKIKESYVTTFWDYLLHTRNIETNSLLADIFRYHILVRTGFSNETKTKAKYRNAPNVAPDLRVQLSNIEPKIK